MATISEALAMAVEHHHAGRFQAAEQLYRQIVQADPQHADAWHLLGLIAFQVQNHAVALDCFARALSMKPDVPEFHSNLGLAYRAMQRLDDAMACQQRALELKPDFAEAHYRLGLVLKAQGHDLQKAVLCYRRSIELKPDYAEALNSLGNALKELGQVSDAMLAYRRAVTLKPNFVEAHNNLGVALKTQGRLDEAIACYRQVLALKPGFTQAHNNLGNALQAQGLLDQAVTCYQTARQLQPDYVEVLNNLGTALHGLGRTEEGEALLRQALRQKPDYAEAHNSLGNALRTRGQIQESILCYRQALQLKPDFSEAHNNLGNALKTQGNMDEAMACYQHALDLKPDFVGAHMNLLSALQYRAGVTLSELSEAHAEFERRHAAPLRGTWRPHDRTRDPDRRLRLGFLSPDLYHHPVGIFLIRALEHLDPQQAEIVCYADRRAEDELTARFRATAATWRTVVGWNDERLAEQIREDGIDILFDLAGHTSDNRLMVFARKPAPIQMTWLGYVGTTGLTAMDYIVADRHEIPSEAESHYQERVLRMPDDYVCYDPPSHAPSVSALPALERGFVTFGCFNNPAKLTATAIEVWATILQRVPDSRLVLKYRGMRDPSVSGRLAELFAGQEIESSRVEFLDWSPHAELLAEYGRIDLALDSFPYSGGLTTCEALWMGVPVVTCAGETFAGRHSLSHLSTVGLTATIARDLDEYVALAVEWATDLARLASVRAGLREQVAASPLCDGPRFAAQLMARLREAWRNWTTASD